MNQPKRQHQGFTLLETLLALALAALLLAGIYAAIDQSWRLTASGKEDVQRAQLARALIQRFEVDIRAITYTPPPVYDETAAAVAAAEAQQATASSSSSSGTTSTNSTASTTGVPPVPNSKPIGIRGTNQWMELSIFRPRRDLLSNATITESTKTSDLREVTYSFQPPGTGPAGLMRAEGDRMAAEALEAKGGTAVQISPAQIIAPEVASLRFRYLDSQIWHDTWNSDTVSRVPRAVEITIGFAPPRRKPSSLNIPTSRSMETFRSVVLIPVSDPFPKSLVK